MEDGKSKCYICGELLNDFDNWGLRNTAYYDCNTCGRYAISVYSGRNIDRDLFSHYLFYNNLPASDTGNFFFYYIGSSEGFNNIKKDYSYAQFLSELEVNAWYPKLFSEKIDTILLGLSENTNFASERIELTDEQIKSMFFVKRYLDNEKLPFENCKAQIDFLSDYMLEQKLIAKDGNNILILPQGMKRIDELQKNQSNSKQAFIAIAFSVDMKEVQEAIEKGIKMAGFIPHVMNKSEHNNQIVPEILYQIKQSKFVVAEFSAGNNGAYYEAGYAAGLKKEVIHLCKKDIFNEEGHFDIKQKSTILWDTIEEIPEALYKRILATIV